MNNNRNNNNNRRRGRGNRPQQGGGNQNRIDSRARGNAPQLLDKYKKLAQDAQHNGDRVQAEYYLQFADHYFRVIADNRARQDEARGGGRPNERDYASDEETSGDEDDFDSMRQGRDDRQRDDRPRDDRPRDDRPRDDRPRDDRPRDDRYREDRNRDDRSRDDRNRGGDRSRPRRDDAGDRNPQGDGSSGSPETQYEPAENPFVAGNRSRERDARPRRGRRDRADEAVEDMVGDRGAIDAAALPPAFSVGVEGDPVETPRKPVRRRRKASGDDDAGDTGGEPLTAVG